MEVSSVAAFKQAFENVGDKKLILFFSAGWYEPCVQVAEVLKAIAEERTDLVILQIDAEKLPTISAPYDIKSIPTILVINNNVVTKTIVGVDIPLIVEALSDNKIDLPSNPKVETKEEIHERIKLLINSHIVMVFMKGTPEVPKCGFSREIIALLSSYSIPPLKFGTFNILSDELVRQEIKVYSNWPSFPQLYINGSLIGGLDITKELHSSGELKEMLSII